MGKHCARWRFAAACGVLFALVATEARAGNIEIILNISGGPTIDIMKGGPFDTSDPTNPNVISVNTNVLNATLAGDGLNLQFSSLGASSNNPGAANATLTQTGEATTLTGAPPAAIAFTTTAFQLDYNSPAGANGQMESSGATTLTNTTAGDFTSFQSWYDGTNTGTMTTASPLLTGVSTGPADQSDSNTAPLTALTPFVTPFALVNEIGVSLAANANGPTDQFTGSTVITAAAVPEPTSFALLGIGMTGFLAFRRFFKRPAVA